MKFGLLPLDFYLREDVVQIARDLIGMVICTNMNGQQTSGMIVETEAYRGPDDKASHAYGNRRTNRTEVMFSQGGKAYVYLCYGIHHLFNVVTAPKEIPHAVLIRGIQPIEGIERMLKRRKLETVTRRLSAGPGTLSQALGITTQFTGADLFSQQGPIWIEDYGFKIQKNHIEAGPRIGIDYAEECILWPWRFLLKNSPWVSSQR